MSQCVTLELQGSTANQPPRSDSRGAITQALHHHAGRKAITSPFPCAVISTRSPHLRISNQGAQMTGEAVDGGKGGWWVQSNGVWRGKRRQNEKDRKTSGPASPLFKPFNILKKIINGLEAPREQTE